MILKEVEDKRGLNLDQALKQSNTTSSNRTINDGYNYLQAKSLSSELNKANVKPVKVK